MSDIVGRVGEWAEDNLQPFGPTLVIVFGAVGYLVVLAWAWQHTSFDVWGAVVLAPLLLALTVPLARRATVDDPSMARMILLAIVLKLLMTLVRYAVAFGVYGGTADAGVYHEFGTMVARHFRDGDLQLFGQSLSSTGFIRIFTGVLYTVIGPTKLGGFLVFSWLGFWGLWLFYRAMLIALPKADHRRYAKLVFFLPSALFWPSSIGKEAWMCLMLGIATYGGARMLASLRGGFPLFALGIWGCATVRPHVGLLAFVALSIGYLLRRPNRQRRRTFGVLPKAIASTLLVVGGMLLAANVEQFFGKLEATNVDSALEVTAHRSTQGGSSFNTVQPTSPTTFAWAAVTVLFRPFPWEASNVQSLLAALEGAIVLALVLPALPRVASALRRPWESPMVAVALVYILMFSFAFSSIGNFGILTRQRVQVIPFLLVLVCLPRRDELPVPEVDSRARARA